MSEKAQLETILKVVTLEQALINTIDELSNQSGYTHTLKQRSNAHSIFLENYVHQFYKLAGVKESEKMMAMVAKIENVLNEIEIEL